MGLIHEIMTIANSSPTTEIKKDRRENKSPSSNAFWHDNNENEVLLKDKASRPTSPKLRVNLPPDPLDVDPQHSIQRLLTMGVDLRQKGKLTSNSEKLAYLQSFAKLNPGVVLFVLYLFAK